MRAFSLAAGGALALAGVGVAVGLAVNSPATAAVQVRTVTFSVANMSCATCPITVKAAMSKVPGVRSVEVSFEDKTATVQFDPAKASPVQIAEASTGVGFPAKLAR